MTFFPDGETHIPNQTPVPGMSETRAPDPGRVSPWGAPPPVPTVASERRRFARVLVRTAVINAGVLVAAVLLAYVFPITHDSTAATFIVVGAVIFSAAHTSVVMTVQQRRQKALGLAPDQPETLPPPPRDEPI